MASVGAEYTADYWLQMGNAFYNNQSYNLALDCYNKTIELNKSYAEAWARKGNALCELDKNEEATNAYKKAFELNPKIIDWCMPCGQQGHVEWYWHDKGIGLLFDNDSNGALQAFNKAIEINPKFSEAWWSKGNVLRNQGKYDEAVQAYTRSNELNPYRPSYEPDLYERQCGDVRYEQGMALKKLGRDSEANAAFDKDPYMPTWMEITTYSQGDGFGSYIILYDKTDTMVSCDGILRIEIYDNKTLLKTKSYTVKKEDFEDSTAGLGAFKHDVTIWKIDRISYDEIGPDLEDKSLEVRAYFDTPDTRILKDKTSEYAS